MLVLHHKKQLIKTLIFFCSLYVVHAIACQDAPADALVTLRNDSRVPNILVKLVGEKLAEIRDPELLRVLAMASTRPDWRINYKHKRCLQALGLFDEDKKFVNTATKNIIALSIALKPEIRLVSPLKQAIITSSDMAWPDKIEEPKIPVQQMALEPVLSYDSDFLESFQGFFDFLEE